MKINIDAGRDGSDPGAIEKNPSELKEKEFNLKS